MKILRTDHSFSQTLEHRNRSLRSYGKRRPKTREFSHVLEQVLGDQVEEGEEFSVLLPKHGHFWDNGYEDLAKEVL
jgi:hypothetical protein